MSRRNIIFVFLVLFGMSVLFAYFQSLPSLLQKKPTLLTGKILTRPMELDNFELIDQNNQTFNSESLKGNWTILFFGYTNCPDVCPTTIYKLAEVKNDVNQNLPSKNFNTVLVTLDPDRDTPERLDEYIGYFDESMLGVTGTYKNIQSFVYFYMCLLHQACSHQSNQCIHPISLEYLYRDQVSLERY